MDKIGFQYDAEQAQFTQLLTSSCNINCETPNNAIYKFEGMLQFENNPGQKFSLDIDNLLLRGSILRNTEFVIGATVFTGHDTKVMQNSSEPLYKFSKLENMTNRSILGILLVQLTLSSIAGLVGTMWL